MSQGAQNAAVFIAVIVIGILVVRLLVRARRSHAPRRHQVVERWKPIVGALAERGVDDRALLVGALANWELRLDPPERVTARLPCAVATVADALGLTLPEVQRTLVSRGADAAGYLEALRGLRPRLEGLPGVVEVGSLWPDDAPMLSRAIAAYAKMSGLR